MEATLAEKPVASQELDVLHVDDDEDWRVLAKIWIGDRSWRSSSVRSRAELIRHFGAHPLPRCLLLDLVLEDADGLELCDLIKNSPAWQGIPIVILTGSRRVSARQCLERNALYRVLKDRGAETRMELCAALSSVLSQQDRSRGLVDAGDLRLDPRGRKVHQAGRLCAELAPGPFAALLAMVRASPTTVADATLHEIFLERRPYHKLDPELAVRLTVRNYVYLLRRQLGAVGARLVRAGDGYAYRPLLTAEDRNQFEID